MALMDLDLYDALVAAGMPEEHARIFAVNIERRLRQRHESARRNRIAAAEVKRRAYRAARGRYLPPKRR